MAPPFPTDDFVPVDWTVAVETDDPPRVDETDAGIHPQEVGLDLQNQSLTLISLLAMHPRPHLALRRLRDLADAWRREPSEQALAAAMRAAPGRFGMNLDQVMQALVPPTQSSRAGSGSQVDEHDIWRALDACQHMHDLFVMALLATHTTPDLVSGQFRTLLERLGKSPVSTTLDATALVAVRRSAMRFDRIVRLVMSARDGQRTDAAVPTRDTQARLSRPARGQAARFLQG
jgi:hypothetical protein